MVSIGTVTSMMGPQVLGMLSDAAAAPEKVAAPVSVGLAMRFVVNVHGLDLGHWQTCSGLSVRFESELLEEGGEYRHATLMPKSVGYGEITLKRAVAPSGSFTVYQWLHSYMDKWVNASETGKLPPPEKSTATIRVLDAKNKWAFAWQVIGVYPKSWTGPELRGDSNSVAMETLVLTYQGFDPSFDPRSM